MRLVLAIVLAALSAASLGAQSERGLPAGTRLLVAGQSYEVPPGLTLTASGLRPDPTFAPDVPSGRESWVIQVLKIGGIMGAVNRTLLTSTGTVTCLAGCTAVVDQNAARLRFIPGRPLYPRDGWWMRVDTGRTKAASIQFTFGESSKDLIGQDSWTRSNQAEMAFPEPLRTAKNIQLNAITTPADATASVCVFFQDYGVAHLEFTGDVKAYMAGFTKTASCTP